MEVSGYSFEPLEICFSSESLVGKNGKRYCILSKNGEAWYDLTLYHSMPLVNTYDMMFSKASTAMKQIKVYCALMRPHSTTSSKGEESASAFSAKAGL